MLRLVFAWWLVVGLLAAPAAAQPASDLIAERLRVEHLDRPVGLDAEYPRFSWALRSPEHRRGAGQSAYRVEVAEVGPEGAARSVWDSGRVRSARQHLVAYAGPALEPGQAYRWRVEVWDDAGRPAATAESAWTTGRMGRWDGASWIGVDSTLADQIGLGPTGTPRLRRAFRLEKPVARAMVHVTGLGQVELFANGRRVGTDLMAPGWTRPEATVLYESYDVTDLLRQGENALGIGLGGGLYRIPQGGPHAANRYAKYWDTIGPFQAILHLTVEHSDGTATTLGTDGRWLAGASPTVFSSIWGGEDYDARLEQPGWAAPGFATDGWMPAREFPGPAGALVAQTNPPIRAHERFGGPALDPEAVTEPSPGVFVVDLGQNHSGMPRLHVRGAAGHQVTLRPAEVLGPDGRVDQTSMKHWGEILFRYTLRGDSAETWQPRYTYTGYRYVQVEGATVDPEDAAARGVPLLVGLESDWVHADAPRVGTFASSNPLVNGIHEMIVGAIRSNMMHVMTDCPHREKLGWLEEAYLMGPSVFYNYDVGTLYAKWVEDMVAEQEPSGLVPTTAPEYTFFGGNFRDSPEWGSAAVQAPWLVRTWTADEAPLRAHYGAMARYTDYLAERAGSDGIIRHGLGDWYDVGPAFPGESQLTSKGVTATPTQAANLDVLARTAALLGRPDDAAHYRARQFDLRGAFNRAFWRADARHYDTGSQTAQAMPLVLGLVPPDRQAATLARLVADVEGRGYHPTAGDVGHRYLVQALQAAGRSDVLFRLATQNEAPSYGAQLLAGATTLTEAWDANPVQSQNHFMLGHLEEWFYAGLAGLRPDPDAPGWERFVVSPAFVEGLEGARATYHSPYGVIESAWEREGDQVVLTVTVPVGSLAQISVPAADPAAVREGDGDASASDGLSLIETADRHVLFEAAPGRYVFRASL